MCAGLTGHVVIDHKGDRIMDYNVWNLAPGSDQFQEHIVIPLSNAGRNTTACVEWLVCIFSLKYKSTFKRTDSARMDLYLCLPHPSYVSHTIQYNKIDHSVGNDSVTAWALQEWKWYGKQRADLLLVCKILFGLLHTNTETLLL